MSALLQLLEFVPVPIRMMILGGVVFAGAEVRYMTVGDFTKSYVLDLKAEIRATRRDISDPNLNAETSKILQEQLEQMLDELCYEVPDDPYCKDRTE